MAALSPNDITDVEILIIQARRDGNPLVDCLEWLLKSYKEDQETILTLETERDDARSEADDEKNVSHELREELKEAKQLKPAAPYPRDPSRWR